MLAHEHFKELIKTHELSNKEVAYLLNRSLDTIKAYLACPTTARSRKVSKSLLQRLEMKVLQQQKIRQQLNQDLYHNLIEFKTILNEKKNDLFLQRLTSLDEVLNQSKREGEFLERLHHTVEQLNTSWIQYIEQHMGEPTRKGGGDEPNLTTLKSTLEQESLAQIMKESLRHFSTRLYHQHTHPYLDPDFEQKSQIDAEFHRRLWENSLAGLLLKQGKVDLGRLPNRHGPDFELTHRETGRRFYMEATCPEGGHSEKPDSMRKAPLGQIYSLDSEKVQLRLLNSVSNKHKQYLNWIEKKGEEERVQIQQSPYVLAISLDQLPEARQYTLGQLLGAFLPIGDQRYSIDPVTREGHYFYPAREHIIKKGAEEGADPVKKGIFLDDTYAYLSGIVISVDNGILYSKLEDSNPLEALANKLILIRNPSAAVELSQGLIEVRAGFDISIEEKGYTIVRVIEDEVELKLSEEC